MTTQGILDFGTAPPAIEWEVRSHLGFRQARAGSRGTWQFCVTGFDGSTSGTAGTCHVLCFDGSEKSVPIDASDRILIAGKWYGRAHWMH